MSVDSSERIIAMSALSRPLLAALVALALGFAPQIAVAQQGETPPSLDGARTVTPAEARAALGAGAVALDVRRRAAYLEGHLPGAQSIVRMINAEANTVDPAAFGDNRARAIVIYGHGSDGWTAVHAVRGAVTAGFTQVLWMRGGFREWSSAGLPVEQ